MNCLLVTASEPRIRVAGHPRNGRGFPVELLWCPDSRSARNRGWQFPLPVERLLRDLTVGASVLHLFGGRASWGIRQDIDPIVRPDVLADAWLPCWAPGSFDVVILDPPYFPLGGQLRFGLQRIASYIARDRVIWFHTHWLSGGSRLETERAWLVRCGRSMAVRCLIVFRRAPGPLDLPRITRGPILRYRRWQVQAESLFR